MGKAEVYLASFWDMVPGTTQLAETRFPPSLNWVCVNQAGAAQIGRRNGSPQPEFSCGFALLPKTHVCIMTARAAVAVVGVNLRAEDKDDASVFVTNVSGIHAGESHNIHLFE